MNTLPQWFLPYFMQTMSVLAALFSFQIIIAIGFIVTGVVWLQRATTKPMGKRTVYVGVVLCGINFIVYFVHLGSTSVGIVAKIIEIIALYALIFWWLWHIYTHFKQKKLSQKKNRS